MDYRASGVDIAEADRAVLAIGPLIRATHGEAVLPLSGAFAGAYRLPGTDRILLASIDGVGTKLKLAASLERYRGVGRDLVNHCVNDVLVHGGRPLFFLDYVGTARLRQEWFTEVVAGAAEACGEAGCALIGGETAEMPGIYHGDDFDLVGAMVAEVSAADFIDGSAIQDGDRLLGLGSVGLHTNGYSLARRIVAECAGDDLVAPFPGGDGASWADALLVPHHSYLPTIRPLIGTGRVHGMAHITGGGIPGNLVRILPDGLVARVDATSWDTPPLFEALGRLGGVSDEEMYRTFNMGIGFVLVVPPSRVDTVYDGLVEAGETVHHIGAVAKGTRAVVLDGLRD